MPNPLEPLFHRLVDGWFASRPRRRPPPDLLQRCRLIAHRGEHDNRTVFENTLTALEASRAAGIWGIEFDVRWTRDLQPVVCHDETLQRVFGIDLRLQSASLTELQKAEPRVPGRSHPTLRRPAAFDDRNQKRALCGPGAPE
jgi:glycerophosphoryl diester phosphodiesterase